MKFSYIKLADGVLRPILPIKISYKKGSSVKYYGLVDSGADKTYIAAELAGLLGIENIYSGREESISGVNGLSKAYFYPITLNIGGWDFNIEAGFMEDSTLSVLGYGILGQIGLFDKCAVKFDFKKREMDIIPNK